MAESVFSGSRPEPSGALTGFARGLFARPAWLTVLFCLVGTVVLSSVAGVAGASIVVRDFAGREVRLEKPAERIVALAPHIVENAFSAGAGEKLVGAVSYSNYPTAARDIPRVGSHQSWSLETVVALKPDLVLLWGSGNGMAALDSLARFGIPVFVSELRMLEQIPATIRAIGRLAGTTAVSEVRAESLERGFARLQQRYSASSPLSVFYQIWNNPLQTVNGEHLISKLFSLCGASNVFSDAVPLAPQVSLESVLLRDPEVILASGMGEARPEWLSDWARYPGLRAVKTGALLFVHPDLIQRPTERILRGAQKLCVMLDDVRRRSTPAAAGQ